MPQTEEYLDVFDENNQPTGVALSRGQVHAEALWHRTVHIYLFRRGADGLEFLLHLRSKLKETSPGLWDTRFGGHIKAGQSVEEGVRDELQEEIGLDTSQIQLIEGEWQKRDNFPNREYTKFYFLEYNDSLENLKFNDGEVDEVKWMNVDTIRENIRNTPEMYSASLEGFEKISNYIESRV
ncbi:MAG: NUDIX domain-containing protein [Candidatus Moranbacteria bacterium]|nr:NUDIX domain-containing protein [Candidatus Moranbacteria bacterium]